MEMDRWSKMHRILGCHITTQCHLHSLSNYPKNLRQIKCNSLNLSKSTGNSSSSNNNIISMEMRELLFKIRITKFNNNNLCNIHKHLDLKMISVHHIMSHLNHSKNRHTKLTTTNSKIKYSLIIIWPIPKKIKWQKSDLNYILNNPQMNAKQNKFNDIILIFVCNRFA